jgi:hypothetical protein
MKNEKDTVSGGGGSRLNLTQKKSHPENRPCLPTGRRTAFIVVK